MNGNDSEVSSTLMKYAVAIAAATALTLCAISPAQLQEPAGNAHEYNPNGMTISHTVPASYEAGQQIEVAVSVNFVDQNGLTAAGVREMIPPGWTFSGMGSLAAGVNPNITPMIGATDELGFAWITVQGVFPSRFSYFVRAAADASGPAVIQGQGSYRTTGGELLTNIDTVMLEGVDTTPPEITIRGNNPVEVVQGSAYNDAGATAMDNVDGNVTANIETTSNVNTDQVGTYTVTYRVRDASGNEASATRTVRVVAERAAGAGGQGGRGARAGNRGYGFGTGSVANRQAAELDRQLNEEAVKAQMEAQRRQEEAAAGITQNALEAQRNPAATAPDAQRAYVPNAPSPGQDAVNMPAGMPGQPMRGAIPTGDVSSTQPPPRTPGGEGPAARASAAAPAAATATETAPRSDYPQDAPGTQLALRTDTDARDPAASAGDAPVPGVLATVMAAFAGMSGGDYVRLGVAILVLAIILAMAAFAWRVAYSPKPQRRHGNGVHKGGEV